MARRLHQETPSPGGRRHPKDFEIGHGLDGLEDPKIFEAFFRLEL